MNQIAFAATGYSFIAGRYLNGGPTKRVPGRRKITGWKKKLDAILAKAPPLTDENPWPAKHEHECEYIRKVDADCECAGRERRINCRRYATCLSYSIAHDWPGFQCAACRVRDDFTLDELRAQAAGVYRMKGLL